MHQVNYAVTGKGACSLPADNLADPILRSHSASEARLQGVEPELYAPAELLSGRGAGLASGMSDAAAAERDPARPHTWFSNLFNGGAANGSTDHLQRDARGATASASALDHPPQARC